MPVQRAAGDGSLRLRQAAPGRPKRMYFVKSGGTSGAPFKYAPPDQDEVFGEAAERVGGSCSSDGIGKGDRSDNRPLRARLALLLSMLYSRLADESVKLDGRGTLESGPDARFQRLMAQAAVRVERHQGGWKRLRLARARMALGMAASRLTSAAAAETTTGSTNGK